MSPRATSLLNPSGLAGPPRLFRLIALAVLIAVGIDHVYYAIVQWPLHDMDVYLAAATRVRDGHGLYLTGDVLHSYWYSPWFAYAWVPLTYLPRIVVAVAWSALLLAATGAVAVLLYRIGPSGGLLALLVGPPLFAVSAGGNVQPLMVLALLWGLHRRSGPVWVALATSLKYTPILFAVVYVARRQWWRAMAAAGIGALLIAPALAGGVAAGGIPSQGADSALSLGWVPYLSILAVLTVGQLVVPPRFAPVTAAAAAVFALPRLFVYDVTLLAAGAAPDPIADTAPER